MNALFQNALKRIPQNTPPVWFMRQAGRYHRHYQALRREHSFVDLCKKPELAAEAALGPVDDFDFDTAILFSDILFPLEAMGMGLSYGDEGPKFDRMLDEENIPKLLEVNESLPALHVQKEALIRTRKILPPHKSLIGFVGGPFTLFAYGVEGTHRRGLARTKSLMNLFQPFCGKIVPLLVSNIELQLEGGAEVVMIFDTAAGELSRSEFRDVVAPVMAGISGGLEGKTAYYAKGITPEYLDCTPFADGGFAGLGVDSGFPLDKAFGISPSGFVQGNFDETALLLDPAGFNAELDGFIERMRDITPEERAGWVCGLGHGVLPKTPEENVRTFVARIREAFA